ncbi:unnamed protein product [Calypogeia fissa]
MDLDSTSLGAPFITDVENTTHASSRRREYRDWVTTIKDDLRQVSQMRPSSAYVMYRVRPQLRALKPQHYAATEFSFGLFDRSPRGTRMTRADKCKLLMGNAVLKLMGMTETEWPKLSQMVVPNPKEMQDRYDELGRDPLSLQEVQSLLTLDAVFLAGFLGSRFYGPFAERLGSAIDPMTTEMMKNSLVTDIFKVENQIPLSLIHTVILILLEKVGVEEHVNRMQVASEILSAVCLTMLGYIAPDLPGRGGDMLSRAEGIHFVQCNSFLDCLYRVMCQGMKESKKAMWTGKEWNLPPVTELQSAGIEFRGRKGTFHDIEFKAGWLKGHSLSPQT